MSEQESTEKPKDEGAAPSSIPAIPSVSSIQSSIKSSIKAGVNAANKVLAELEDKADTYGKPVVKSLQNIEHEGEVIANKATKFYDQRKQYAPEIIGGSALLVGGIVGLRRGKLPAVATGAVTGFLAYLGVYELDLHRMPDIVFGKEGDKW